MSDAKREFNAVGTVVDGHPVPITTSSTKAAVEAQGRRLKGQGLSTLWVRFDRAVATNPGSSTGGAFFKLEDERGARALVGQDVSVRFTSGGQGQMYSTVTSFQVEASEPAAQA